MNLDEYMKLLEQRRAEWAALPKPEMPFKPKAWIADPLLERFVRPGDEDLVDLPESQPAEPKPAPRSRTYRSAASLREERARLQARLDAYIDSDDGSPAHDALAGVNLSTQSRHPGARAAGRRRFAQMDRDLERVANLYRRISALDSRIATAEAREARALSRSREE
jgi:hypothetical protein